MKTNIKRSREDFIFDCVNYFLLGLLFLIIAYPLYFIVIASFSDPYLVLDGEVLLYPKGFTLDGYKRVFSDTKIWIGYRNTALYTVVGTSINVFLTMLIGYPLSRKNFSGRKPIMIYLMITMFFSGGLIPTYLLVQRLHLRNTWLVMVLLGAVSVYNVIITRTFLEANIPQELEEAAAIDGCGQIKFFFSFVMPLSKAILSVLLIYYAVGHWNDYMRGMIYLDDPKKHPLQLVLRSILLQSQTVSMTVATDADVLEAEARMKVAEGMKYGVIIVSSLPVLVLYPFMQKYFEKGVMIGSVKG